MNETYAITNDGVVYMFDKGKPLKDIPKSWKQSKIICFEGLINNYNSGLVTIYEVYGNQNITFRYSMYTDGSFYPICGICSTVKLMPQDTYIPKYVKEHIWMINDVERFKR